MSKNGPLKKKKEKRTACRLTATWLVVNITTLKPHSVVCFIRRKENENDATHLAEKPLVCRYVRINLTANFNINPTQSVFK